MNTQKVLVTGGAGYIGSHTALALIRAGFDVIVLDNLIRGHRDVVDNVLQAELVTGDTSDRQLLDRLFQQYAFAGVVHLAAFAYVGESVAEPQRYYRNNVAGTLTLLEAMKAASVSNFVFSSTCAVYGMPESLPLTEQQCFNPMSPYGQSKAMVERILRDFDHAHGLRSVCLRYFNAAGADPDGLLGEDHDPETHLIPLLLLTALGRREAVTIFGDDYATPDGTCIRDYVHVSDLATAHVAALNYLLNGGGSQAFNLGSGHGFSVKQVVDAACAVTGRTIKTVIGPRREGDPAALVASSGRAGEVLGWTPQYRELETILEHAWHWHRGRHAPV